MLKVTNMVNGKSVVVRVTDRGPHRRGRIIDLSYRAAKEIDMLLAGAVSVEVEVVDGKEQELTTPYRLPERQIKKFDFEVAEVQDDYRHPHWQKDNDAQPTGKTKQVEKTGKEIDAGSPKKHGAQSAHNQSGYTYIQVDNSERR